MLILGNTGMNACRRVQEGIHSKKKILMNSSHHTKKSRYSQKQSGTKYSRRIKREKELEPAGVKGYTKLLSGNKKTGAAINLPLLGCRPSPRCAEICYAMEGFVAAPHVMRATLRMDHVLRTGEHIDRLVKECQKKDDVRLLGIGDFVKEHLPLVIHLACKCPDTIFWGFTRKRENAERLNGIHPNLSIVLSWDPTHPGNYAKGYEGPMSYGPIQPGEGVPKDPRIIVVFPEHHQSHPDRKIEKNPKDCPATRIPAFREGLKTQACQRCGRCLRPHDVKHFDTTHFYEI